MRFNCIKVVFHRAVLKLRRSLLQQFSKSFIQYLNIVCKYSCPESCILSLNDNINFIGVMVMKASVEDDDSGWELGIPEKMEKGNTNWVDITQDFVEACRGEFEFLN